MMITGAILLAVGVWGKLTLGTYISLIAENSTNAPYVLIGTGTTIIVFGLFGCFATCRGSPWMLKLYAMFLSLVFLAELVAGISGFVFRHEIKVTFLRTYNEAVLDYNANDERSKAVDYVQTSVSKKRGVWNSHSLRCCGVQNYTSWFGSNYFPKNGIPHSCCANASDCSQQDMRNATIASTKVYQQGCYDLVTSFMETNMGIIAGVAFGIAFSQISESNNQRHSLFSAMNRFIGAVNNMDQIVMVPSLLRDVPLEYEEEKDEVNNAVVLTGGNGAASYLTDRDMYSYYVLLKSIRNDIEWGVLQQGDDRKKEKLSTAVDICRVDPEEEDENLQKQFHFHLSGLHTVLSKLTRKANSVCVYIYIYIYIYNKNV
ncbi:UNVERIFIED_CONTAM: hypothetical protein FKN15_032901 [Acipenser sinensis]